MSLTAQAVEDGGAHGGVALGLLGVEADDVAARLGGRAPIADGDLLDLEGGLLVAGPRDDQRHHRLAVRQHDLAHLLVGALARAEDVLDATRFQLDDRLVTDHAAIGDHAHPREAEALAQTVDDRQQRLHVGGVAGPGLGTDRPAVVVDDDPDDHLAQVRTMVLRLAMPAEGLAAGAVEEERGGIEQHDGEIGEQASPTFEQRLLDQILGATRRACCATLIVQCLAQPDHRAIELVQLQAVSTIDVIGLLPRSQARSEPDTISRCSTVAKTARSTENSNAAADQRVAR